LKAWALEAGFDRVGVATLASSANGEALRDWLDKGYQAGMQYLERNFDRRIDARSSLAGAKSVLCVALQYAPAADAAEEGDLWPGVARYARGQDYHRVMEKRLRALGRRVEESFPGARTRSYVDTGPLLERELAACAGLGAVGKNTLLLHPEAGSYFLLGELLLTLDLEPDPPIADLCGSCTACLDACPTGAFPAPFVLDSRRCISYLTIEHRGDIPAEMREQLEGWIFGCDICQEVCPWNADPTPARDAAFSTPESRRDLSLVELLGMSRDDYLEAFRGSPMKRARLDGLSRNAALALAHRRRSDAIDALLTAAADDREPVVAEHARWAAERLTALGETPGPESEAEPPHLG
jgi:epoxyqueuosine reductase